MRCVAIKACQKRMESGRFKGRIVFFKPGEIGEFEECPEGFRPIGTTVVMEHRDPVGDTIEYIDGIDFASATEEELFETEFNIEELKEYMSLHHPAIKIPYNIGREKLIQKFVYARTNDTEATDSVGELDRALGVQEENPSAE